MKPFPFNFSLIFGFVVKLRGTSRRIPGDGCVSSNSVHTMPMDGTTLDYFADTEESVQELVRLVRPPWKSSRLVVRVFTGGVTNRLYGVRAEHEAEARTLLVRIFGEGTDLMIDRRKEQEYIALLHQYNLAEPLLATFKNGFVYGYVMGKPMTVQRLQMADGYPKVARHMALLHSIPKQCDGGSVPCPEPVVLSNLRQWLALVPRAYRDADVQRRACGTLPSRRELSAEVDAMAQLLAALDSPLVFGHNDTTAGNILEADDSAERVAFIDHEYAGWNLRCFDLGNMFCEYCGVDSMDFDLYPTRPERHSFLTEYARKASELGNEGSVDLKVLHREANVGALASNLHWGLWGMVQAEHSRIEFDYVQYSRTRLTEYFKQKKLLEAAA